MFRNLFNPDSDLMIFMGWVTDAIFLSIFWFMGCMPIVTIGTSTAALYDAVFYGFRKHSKHSWGRFWRAYIKNFKASLVPTLVFLVLCLAAGVVLITLWNGAVANGTWIAFAAGAVIGIVLLGILSVLFPMLSRFENGFGQLLGNTVRLALANLPRIVALALVNGLTIFACVRLVLPIFFLPAVAALVSTLFIEPMFRPYLSEEFYEILSED